jgi:hypothetical protein
MKRLTFAMPFFILVAALALYPPYKKELFPSRIEALRNHRHQAN